MSPLWHIFVTCVGAVGGGGNCDHLTNRLANGDYLAAFSTVGWNNLFRPRPGDDGIVYFAQDREMAILNVRMPREFGFTRVAVDTPHIVISVCLRVTRRCNAACSFCQAPNTSRAELTLDQIRILSLIFASAGVLSIKLSGGEPTVRPDLPDIIEAISAAGPKVVITTNGIRISDEVLDTAVRHSAEFKFSIHRPDMANDDVLRVRSFGRIMRNLDSCRQRSIPFALNTVVTSQTMKLMGDMVRFALTQGARKISFIPVLPRGRAATSCQDGLDTRDLSLVRARVAALGRSYGDRIKVSCIDIRLRDYWVVENDGSLWIERSTEGLDVRVCGYGDLLRESSLLVNISL